MRFFEESARQLSFNRAARALYVTQGAVSRQIRQLEQSLGVKLFERDQRGVRLTPAGVLLNASVAEAFDAIERGTCALAGSSNRKRLIMCLPPTFATQWLSPRLSLLAVQLPGVELSLRTQPSDACHCAIRFGRDPLAEGHSELLITERHALVGSASLAGQDVETLLEHLPALHVLHDDIRLELWPNWLAAAHWPQRLAENGIEFSNLEQAIQAAKRGVGLAVVDLNMIVDELAEGVLVKMSEVEVSGPFGYWLDVPARNMDSPHVSAVAAWLLSQVPKE
ncbi:MULTISPECIES: LysR family transcriptional regulator [unclassified Caballeronia]|uniref:LysR family transcriptional regulator n=1 Tax=unclassified Caballeronia TaxID=2646786 RepID=UPI0028670A8E|nr:MULTISPECIES: LysR family transcriptional regulator [unclassified Caballeronia]MDR5754585.1 LysR family transcriptional regulator [Caballeronia sp. LZ024]MDR5839557.1 LysR family transcriptional regulator [Caballeronia sp. LZ031]